MHVTRVDHRADDDGLVVEVLVTRGMFDSAYASPCDPADVPADILAALRLWIDGPTS